MADLGIAGLASGFDWKTFVDQMIEIQRVPEKRLLSEQNDISQRNIALSSIKTQFGVLSTRVDALKDTGLFSSRSTAVSDEGIATATSSGSSPLGTFTLDVTQLATAAKQRGVINIGSPLATSSDVSGVVLGNASFTTPVADGGAGAGAFKINGVSISFSQTGDSVQNVIDRINNSAAGVTASYDGVNDRFILVSKTTGDQGIALEDVIGNFLAATGLTTGTLEH